MATKRQNILIIGCSALIAIAVWVLILHQPGHQPLQSRIFKSAHGWGYDILMNDTIVIHQENIPVLQEQTGFPEREQAELAASNVLTKLKEGKRPTLTRAEVEKICPPKETAHAQQGNPE